MRHSVHPANLHTRPRAPVLLYVHYACTLHLALNKPKVHTLVTMYTLGACQETGLTSGCLAHKRVSIRLPPPTLAAPSPPGVLVGVYMIPFNANFNPGNADAGCSACFI